MTTVRSSELLAKLELEDIDIILRESRLRWFGNVKRSSGVVRLHVIYRFMAGGGREAQANMEKNDRERLPWVEAGDQVWELLCVQLASYLKGDPLMWMMSLHLHVNQKSDYDYEADMKPNKASLDINSFSHIFNRPKQNLCLTKVNHIVWLKYMEMKSLQHMKCTKYETWFNILCISCMSSNKLEQSGSYYFLKPCCQLNL